MQFANPEYFFLLLLLIPILLWYFLIRGLGEPTLRMATTEQYRNVPRTFRTTFIHLPFVLRTLTIIILIVILARPQTSNALREREVEGIDIMMAMDVSTSMLARDLKPNRIEAAKEVAYKFISNRPNDNIGLTLFGGEAFTQCPITTDHATLLNMFHNVSCEMQAKGIISPGTAIGMGLANAVSHLEKSKSKSKVIILLTDGVNNVGEISPLTAADMAKENGIRVYTIAIGASSGKSKQAVATLPNGEEYYADVENDSDPETLKAIAHTTGGLFYQAETSDKLKTIYDDIDKLEKTKLKVKNFDRKYEAFQFLGYAVLVLFLLEIILHLTIFRRMP